MTSSKKEQIGTPSYTQKLLKEHQFALKKKYGQNFLTDLNILERIIEVAELDQKTNVIEIGPGFGALTEQLARSANEVLAYEIDQQLLPILNQTLADYDQVTVIGKDILKADITSDIQTYFTDPTLPVHVVANLPYYITTPILMHLIETKAPIDRYVMMMQKEVAERIQAGPGTKAYGSLSIAIQYYMEASIAFTVPSTVFIPKPNVDSAILVCQKRAEPLVEVTDESLFFKLVRGAFQQRRKTLWNNLLALFGKDEQIQQWLKTALNEADILPSIRAEQLSIQEFAALSNALSALSPT